ncbi:transcriptional regulator protein [Methanimicrococcus blatticola]|uniref:transcriptional regulator protein n=1 Tax=Methanimicrococcus blatticola TaxID=91560 RepID=UPI001060E177|nr:transcriptional regulator protein [Methanimicrococcus blatticola]MBZ3935231.1 transcriptional regulator protein [Methanimicrococcus blatticola]
MIDFEVKILDENDLVFVSDLRNLGIQRNVALTLVYLSNVKEASSREIEIGTGLRQPEISLAINFMSDNKWIDSRMIRVNKKGRPLRVYSFCVPMETIYAFYELKAHKDYEESVLKINQLKVLIQKKDYT